MALSLIAGAGAVAGIAAKIADESSIRWIGDLGTYPALWVLALALIGRYAPSPGQAAARASTFFATVCLAYYAWSRFVLDFPVDRNFWLWTGLAVTAVPVMAFFISGAYQRTGPVPGLLIAGLASLAIVDGTIWQLWWSWGGLGAPEGFPLRPFQASFNVVAVFTIAGLLPRDRITRIWSLLAIIPCVIVMTWIVDLAMGNLYRLV